METQIHNLAELRDEYIEYLTENLLEYSTGLHTLKHSNFKQSWFKGTGDIVFYKSHFFRVSSIQIDDVEIDLNTILIPISADKEYLKKVYTYGKEFLISLQM